MSSGARGSKTPFPSLAESTRLTGRLSPIFSTAPPQGITLYSMANTLHVSFLEDHETDSSHEKDYPGEAAPSLPHLVVPLNSFQQLSSDLLSLTSSITQSSSKVAGAPTTDKNPTVPATSGATATQSTNPLDTTASIQAAKRQASFLKKASSARTHHAEDDFSKTLFRSVMGRDPNEKSN